MKLYGITTTLGFPCICYGKTAWFFKLIYAKKLRKFKFYHGHTTSNDVAYNFIHNRGKRFFGLIIKELNDYDLF